LIYQLSNYAPYAVDEANPHSKEPPMKSLMRLLIALFALSLAAFGMAACSPEQLMVKPAPTIEAPPINNELVQSVEKVASAGDLYTTPWDASPDPDGNNVYFTASSQSGAGLFHVALAAGKAEKLAVGAPFTMPVGLAVSSDGARVYVADPLADAGGGKTGAIFAVSAQGGAPQVVAGTEGTAPRALEVANENGSDVTYFSGVSGGKPALMKIAASGGRLHVLIAGSPLVEPGGIAVTKEGKIYVADRLGGGYGLATVFEIDGDRIDKIVGGFRAGDAVIGATLLMDESALLISALAPDKDSAQVLVITLPGLKKFIVNKTIGDNTGSGGLHRAHNANVFAWSGTPLSRNGQRPNESEGDSGVYFIK
jgi:DNA-binding beta-propeller fold protein YncE